MMYCIKHSVFFRPGSSSDILGSLANVRAKQKACRAAEKASEEGKQSELNVFHKLIKFAPDSVVAGDAASRYVSAQDDLRQARRAGGDSSVDVIATQGDLRNSRKALDDEIDLVARDAQETSA